MAVLSIAKLLFVCATTDWVSIDCGKELAIVEIWAHNILRFRVDVSVNLYMCVVPASRFQC